MFLYIYQSPYSFSLFGLFGYVVLVLYFFLLEWFYKNNNLKSKSYYVLFFIHIIIILFSWLYLHSSLTYANEGWLILLIVSLVIEIFKIVFSKNKNENK